MDAYQKVLTKLFEATGGKETEQVDFKELVKSIGFLPSYPDIFQQLSRQGWIAETTRADVVKITHWGVKEAKKLSAGSADGPKLARKEINKIISEVRELEVFLEEFANGMLEDMRIKSADKAQAIADSIRKLKA
jgi:hypothetical protein